MITDEEYIGYRWAMSEAQTVEDLQDVELELLEEEDSTEKSDLLAEVEMKKALLEA